MRTLIVVDSQFGNTHRIAEALARGVHAADAGSGSGSDEVRVVIASEVTGDLAASWRPDLLLVGGPTVSRRMRPELQAAIGRLGVGVRGVPAAAFDTRYRGSELFMGSAAKRAMDALRKAGCPVAGPKESFYVAGATPPAGERRRQEDVRLEAGEEDRAEAWGRAVAAGRAGALASGRVGAAAG